MTQPSQGVITIQRPGQFFAAGLRDFIVRIDGERVGRVERGERVDFTVKPGEHTVDVSMDWSWLRPRRVVVEPGSRTELAISARPGGALKLCLPMMLAILVFIALIAVLRQSMSFTDSNWLLRSAVLLFGYAAVFAGHLLVTRKCGSEYWDYWAVYTLEPVRAATSSLAEPSAASEASDM